MTRFKKPINKVWVFAAATTLIAGSGLAMNMILGTISANASPNVVTSEAAKPANNQATTSTLFKAKTGETDASVEYTIIDNTRTVYDNKNKIREKLSMQKGITQAEIEKQLNALLSKLTPGEKDISTEQAAANAADLLKKAFGANLSGYIAETNFAKGAVPDTDTWFVTFSKSELSEDITANRMSQSYYDVTMNSVSGKIINAGFYNASPTQSNVNPNGPAWKEHAEQYVTTFLPKDVSIRSSKVVSARFDTGVSVVCELSNGSAYWIRMVGVNKEIASFVFFPDGYDRSLEDRPTAETAG